MRDCDELLAEAAGASVDGWSFGWMKGRAETVPPPWDFTTLAGDALAGVARGLDMGTGGGEWLSSVPHHAAFTVATESWPPNVPVAARRLSALNIPVAHSEGAVDNHEQVEGRSSSGRLPFPDAAFDVVLNRHESYLAAEVARVLRPGGQFLTQQAGTATDVFCALLGLPVPEVVEFELPLALEQVAEAGLDVLEYEQGVERITFGDVGVFARYLRQIPWAVPGFTIDEHRDALARLHGRPIEVAQQRFWLRAEKPAPAQK